MSENEETRKILHRVVFYDLLSTPDIEHQRDTYDRIHEAHLSIPLMPGLETVWAPNGYGKTFAMQMLERMWKPTQYSSDQWTTRGGVHWLSDFLRECQSMVLDISDSPTSQKIRESSFHDVEELSKADWTPAGVQRMVPFSLMMARIVELDSNDQIQEVSDLWIKPNWDNFVNHGIQVEVSRIPMFANYEFKINEVLQHGDSSKYLNDQLDDMDEEARSFITERDSWKKESSLLEKAGLDLSKFIEETENEYWNPIIPSTFNWKSYVPLYPGNPRPDRSFQVEPYQSGYYDEGEWKSGDTTRDRRPPVPRLKPFDFVKGSSIDLEMSSISSSWNEINSLMEVLRTTKIDYVEIPKESLEFFEDPDRATQKVTEITNNLDTSKIQMIEDKINDVLRMKGDTDPWSRKVSLASPLSRKSFAMGASIMGPRPPLDFSTKEARIIRLNRWQPTRPLEIPAIQEEDDDGNLLWEDKEKTKPKTNSWEPPRRQIRLLVPSGWQTLVSFTERIKDRIEEEEKSISGWKELLAKAESNVATVENDLGGATAEKLLTKLAAEKKKIQSELEIRITLKQKLKKKDTPENQELLAKLVEIESKMSRIAQDVTPGSLGFRRQYQYAKEQLALIAEILNELQKNLAFYEESYLILKMFKLEDYEIPDVDRDNPLHFLHTQLSHLGQITDLEQETLEKYESDSSKFTSTLRNKTMFEAYISKLNWMKDTLERERKTRFEVESPYRSTPLRKEVLSFGQKSTILTELYLGTFEALSAPSSDIDEDSFNENRYCLIIDEPEVGRSEYSLNHLITRLISSKTAHDAELNNSVVVLSHRNKLLKQVSGKYHLLQPVDIGYQTEEE